MKIKCVKTQCPICHITGSAQLFLNKKNEIRYARIRHYKGLSKNKKPQFDYHKVEDLEALKTLLKTNGISFSTSKTDVGQIGQAQTVNDVAPKPKDSSLNFNMAGPLGLAPKRGQVQLDETHQCLPKLGFMCSNPTPAPKLGHLTSLFCHHNITNLN
jgi:hypothetical protein